MEQKHHLAAILFTDIDGYTAMMQAYEGVAVVAIDNHNEVVKLQSAKCQREVADFYGDGCLVLFHSDLDALECAISQSSVKMKTNEEI